MSAPAGLAEWLIPPLFAAVFLVLLFAIAWRNTKRQSNHVRHRRPNPSRDDFMALMRPDVSEAASAFLWDLAAEGLQPALTPHPEDLLGDLPLDEDEWSLDWPRDFAHRHGLTEDCIPDWPDNWPSTIRNYGRWLDLISNV